MSEPRKRTSWRIRLADTLAAYVIAFGALGTIAAILLVVFVLLWTTIPLLRTGKLADWATTKLPHEFEHVAVDETGTVLWGLSEDSIEVLSLYDGSLLADFPLQDSQAIRTCSVLSSDGKQLSLGYSDGTYRTVSLKFDTTLVTKNRLPTTKNPKIPFSSEDALYVPFDEVSWRKIFLPPPDWSHPRKISDQPIVSLDLTFAASANRLSIQKDEYALAVSDQKLLFARVETQENMFSGEITELVDTSHIAIQSRSQPENPPSVMLLNGSQDALVVWNSGTIDRFRINTRDELEFRESVSTTAGTNSITTAIPMTGRQMAVIGTEDGRMQAWLVSTQQATGESNALAEIAPRSEGLMLAHEVDVSEDSIATIACSERQHLVFAGSTTRKVAKVYQLTTDNLVVSQDISHAVRKACFSSDGQRLICVGEQTASFSVANFMHPQASWKGLFSSVWYQGHDAPEYIWQPASGSGSTEAKLSLIPLLFGTLKATFFAMLVGVPLAIGAAVYTNSFLSTKARSGIKPAMELMANFPAVIIGYVVASVLAPVVRNYLTEFLVLLTLLPITFYYLGLIWNFFPQRFVSRYGPYQLLFLVVGFVPAITLSLFVSRTVNTTLFAGDLSNWLGNRQGATFGGWFCLFFLSFLAIAGIASVLNTGSPKHPSRSARHLALWSLIKTSLMFFALGGLAAGCASFLTSQGFDVRQHLTVGYQDGNAMLLGLALGFFVVPIIYTIADDAIQAVPNHLREASAACGASDWQTTTRIVLPAATSGLVSATMLGVGRAAGETMIVLMVAGNTPILDWSPFSGLRTLTSTLAIELPKATKGSTHFHTLFLAALLLFAITLAANWIAELIRAKFRKSIQGL